MSKRLASLLRADPIVMRVLKAVRDAGPEGAFVAAGFIRNRVWDSFYPDNKSPSDLDIDVVYFDAAHTAKATEHQFEERLDKLLPTGIWQVRNQARMHSFGGHAPFKSLEHGLMHWAETATTVGARLNGQEVEFIAPFGFDDLWGHVLRITPIMKRTDPVGFDARLDRKGWLKRWPNLKVVRD